MASSRWKCMCSHRLAQQGAARAFLTLDVIMVAGLTIVLLLLFAAVVKQYATAQHDSDAREAALRAAERELTRIEAGLSPLPVPGVPRERVEGANKLEITATPGEQEWSGALLVRVTVRRLVHAHWVQATLAAYVPVEGRHEH